MEEILTKLQFDVLECDEKHVISLAPRNKTNFGSCAQGVKYRIIRVLKSLTLVVVVRRDIYIYIYIYIYILSP
jgi:hypothetical protein